VRRQRQRAVPQLYRRMLKLKAKLESSSSHYSFKSLLVVPGGFNMGFIGSSCSAPPRSAHLMTMLSTIACRSRCDLISMNRSCFNAFLFYE